MNLKVIHLIRKIERINRDMEEIQSLLGYLQMDREYSQKLKESLIEEFHRLKKLKKEILKQVIRIPPEFANLLDKIERMETENIESSTNLENPPHIEIIKTESENNINKNLEINNKEQDKDLSQSNKEVFFKKNKEQEENNSSKNYKDKKVSSDVLNEKSKKKSHFLFKYE